MAQPTSTRQKQRRLNRETARHNSLLQLAILAEQQHQTKQRQLRTIKTVGKYILTLVIVISLLALFSLLNN